MKEHVSPKQLARAVQVSESSIKRWCDQGLIQIVRTGGGHRRIAVADAMKFLREHNYELIRPEVLGLPCVCGKSDRMLDRSEQQFREGLLHGDEQQMRQICLDLYAAKHSLSKILDEVMAKAFHYIGYLWSCGEAEVYQERRGCEMCLRILNELRGMVPLPDKPRGLAMGATPYGDNYHVPNAMVDLVLYAAGWDVTTLGVGLPFESLELAVNTYQPRLFWLSVSHIEDPDAFVRGYKAMSDNAPSEVAFVVGGQALTESIRRQMRYASYCDSLQHLECFAHSLGETKADPPAAQ